MSYTNSENILVCPHGETYPACHDGNQGMNMKAEEVSDAEEEKNPVPKIVQQIKAEPESYTNSENVLMGPHCEIYPACHNGNQAMNRKAEEVSYAEGKQDSVAVTFPEIKAEPEHEVVEESLSEEEEEEEVTAKQQSSGAIREMLKAWEKLFRLTSDTQPTIQRKQPHGKDTTRNTVGKIKDNNFHSREFTQQITFKKDE